MVSRVGLLFLLAGGTGPPAPACRAGAAASPAPGPTRRQRPRLLALLMLARPILACLPGQFRYGLRIGLGPGRAEPVSKGADSAVAGGRRTRTPGRSCAAAFRSRCPTVPAPAARVRLMLTVAAAAGLRRWAGRENLEAWPGPRGTVGGRHPGPARPRACRAPAAGPGPPRRARPPFRCWSRRSPAPGGAVACHQ